jgi:hypothetical protein
LHQKAVKLPPVTGGQDAVTTNVIDKQRRLLASDSRWSCQCDPDHIAYVDDTGFDKMADRTLGSLICAGSALLIEAWREWFLQPKLDLDNKPRVYTLRDDGAVDQFITVSLLLKPECQSLFSFGQYIEFEDIAKFGGTGAQYARDCYSMNRCGLQAVATATGSDPMTGGEIKYVDFANFKNNLSTTKVSAQDAFNQLQSRGMKMNVKTGKIEPLNPKAEPGHAMSAEALSAPTGQAPRKWSEREIEDFHNALKRLADLEEAANR